MKHHHHTHDKHHTEKQPLTERYDAGHGHAGGINSHATAKGNYYCPMRCEGDKTYPNPGDCPVCGMALVEKPDTRPRAGYTCPMHPEILQDSPGSCPICGMTLVPLATDDTGDESSKTYSDLLFKMKVATACTLPVFVIAMAGMWADGFLTGLMPRAAWNWTEFALSIPVVFYAGWMFFRRAYRSVVTWNLNMFTLIGIGTGTAFVFSVLGLVAPGVFPPEFRLPDGSVHLYFEAATVVLTLILLGQLLEARAHERTGSAIKKLIRLAPTHAIRVEGGEAHTVPLGEVVEGDILRVRPGDKVPVDGTITEGDAILDESMVTGEPIPAEKSEGDRVTAGTLNGDSAFLMRADKVGADTLLSHIIDMVDAASRSRAPIQNLADRVARYFVPAVVLIAAATFAVWAILGPEPRLAYGFVNAVAVLIIACPCALGLATPISVMVGVGKGAQMGILIRNAEALEKMSQVDVLVTDKTGTLTEGKPSVEKIVTDGDAGELVRLAAALNQNSGHPLARAITDFRKDDGALPKVTGFRNESGKGVTGRIGAEDVATGNEKLFAALGIAIPEKLSKEARPYRKAGKTVSYISVAGDVKGFVVISDAIKPTTAGAIKALQQEGIGLVMLTGDNPDTAAAVASELGIRDFKAGATPDDKRDQIARLQKEGKTVAMAGDGINDAPALAQADVGIAMGAGTDVAIESAGITLVRGDLAEIVRAARLSHAVMRNIRQNLFFAFGYNLLGIPVAAGVLYPAFGILLSPMIAALAMSCSSVSVILNALRLRSAQIKTG